MRATRPPFYSVTEVTEGTGTEATEGTGAEVTEGTGTEVTEGTEFTGGAEKRRITEKIFCLLCFFVPPFLM
jgi:hypothetical protein